MMSQAILIAVITFILAADASAQTGREKTRIQLPPQEGSAPLGKKEHLKNLNENVLPRVKMSQTQKVKVTKIFDDFFSKVEAQQKSGTPITKELMDQTIAAKDAQLKATLNAEQIKDLIRAERSIVVISPHVKMQEHLRKQGPQKEMPARKSANR